MKRVIISFLVALFVSSVVFFILSDFGITWDEPVYFVNGDRYISWYKNPIGDRDAIFKFEKDQDIHPPFRKVLTGLTHDIFTNSLHILDNTRGYRVSSLLLVFPFVFAMTYLSIGYFGYWIGILISLVFSFLPAVLFFTPLVTLDYAVAVLCFLTVVTFMKGVRGGVWFIISAILMGAALSTKLHGFLIYIPVFIWWCITYWSALRKKIFSPLSIFFLYIFLSLSVYFFSWPWLWSHPFEKIVTYFRMQLEHQSVPVWFLGRVYDNAPWYYPLVWFFATTPVFFLIFFIIGVVGVILKGTRNERFFLFNALFPIFFFSLPFVYRYDGIRLYLASLPFAALVAGVGIYRITSRIKQKVWRHSALFFIFIFWISSLYTSVIQIHPFESSYFNEVIGGVDGAEKIGLEVEYWGNAYKEILPWMNSNKGKMMCVIPMTSPFYYYQAMGQIEGGVIFNSGGACEYVVILMRRGLFKQFEGIEKIVATQKPLYSVRLSNTDLVGVYKKPSSLR